MPSGRFLMEDFYYAGGLPAVMQDPRRPSPPRRADGQRPDLGDHAPTPPASSTMRSSGRSTGPVKPLGGIAVLAATSRRSGAVIKPSAAAPRLMSHRGRAVVFDASAISAPASTIPTSTSTPTSILVLKGAGPRGYPGMPEVGNLPLPKKLLAQGITDMVRISDARMSGTAYGTVVLHVAPGGRGRRPAGAGRDRRLITLDVPGRRLELDVDAASSPPAGPPGPRPRRVSTAAMEPFSSTTCCKPTAASTSTSWSAAAARPPSASRSRG